VLCRNGSLRCALFSTKHTSAPQALYHSHKSLAGELGYSSPEIKRSEASHSGEEYPGSQTDPPKQGRRVGAFVTENKAQRSEPFQ
jgi:hypothetical protein